MSKKERNGCAFPKNLVQLSHKTFKKCLNITKVKLRTQACHYGTSIEQRAHNQKLQTEIHETFFQCSCTHSKVI